MSVQIELYLTNISVAKVLLRSQAQAFLTFDSRLTFRIFRVQTATDLQIYWFSILLLVARQKTR